MSVRIRMKQFGRKHRPYYRICAMDIRRPRDGRVLEELGTYDPLVPETDARAASPVAHPAGRGRPLGTVRRGPQAGRGGVASRSCKTRIG